MSASTNTTKRPPVVAIMGHVDHGKSTLLDTIRNTNIVDTESGGITQHLSAYSIDYVTSEKTTKSITFIDTPGHAAFSGMRERGAAMADLAILIVAANDGVKTQTIEAINTILDSGVPFIVAINKIDLPGADPIKVKSSLIEHGIYVEGFGGDISVVEISAKQGTNIDELLETLLLTAELEEFTATVNTPAEGYVLEAHLDEQRGTAATLIVKDGTLNGGEFVVAGTSVARTRLMENFLGKTITTAGPSTPVTLIGFDTLPEAGTKFITYSRQKDAKKAASDNATVNNQRLADNPDNLKEDHVVIPIIIKTDVDGTREAVEQEIRSLSTEDVYFKILKTGSGQINESDIQLASTDTNTIIIAFRSKPDSKARSHNGFETATIKEFEVIYAMTEWLEQERAARKPRRTVETITGTATVLKVFKTAKDGHIVGCKVNTGALTTGKVRVIRQGEVLGLANITNLQHAGGSMPHIEAGLECGVGIEFKHNFAEQDQLEKFEQTIE